VDLLMNGKISELPSNHTSYAPSIQQRRYSTSRKVNLNPSVELYPWFVTGFSDAESCFSIKMIRNQKFKVGWRVQLVFNIILHQKDKALLEQIKSYFCAGSISLQGSRQSLLFQVCSVKDLAVVISHFEKYPLITQKRADYLLFKQAYDLILNKEHLTKEGLNQIVAIKSSMNRGLSDEFQTAFPNILPVPRPLVVDPEIKDPHWLAGFTTGEGCFLVVVKKSPTNNTGFSVNLVFDIAQHVRDEQLMRSLVSYFGGCGRIKKVSTRPNSVNFVVAKFSDIENKIILFFEKYSIEGIKSKDFADWCKAADLMKNNAHLTVEGLDQIRKIKARMNTGRILD
jgi:hypothetical protein